MMIGCALWASLRPFSTDPHGPTCCSFLALCHYLRQLYTPSAAFQHDGLLMGSSICLRVSYGFGLQPDFLCGHTLSVCDRLRSLRGKDAPPSAHDAGAYFVTMLSHMRKCLFGEVATDRVVLNTFGEIVADEWKKSGDIRKNMEFDVFVIMPNHIHGIVHIVDCRGDQPVVPITKPTLADGTGDEPDVPTQPSKQPFANRRGDRLVAPTTGSTVSPIALTFRFQKAHIGV